MKKEMIHTHSHDASAFLLLSFFFFFFRLLLFSVIFPLFFFWSRAVLDFHDKKLPTVLDLLFFFCGVVVFVFYCCCSRGTFLHSQPKHLTRTTIAFKLNTRCRGQNKVEDSERNGYIDGALFVEQNFVR